MSARPFATLFGIPITVEPWFFVGLFVFYSLSGGDREGLFTAVGIAVFVLIHELGHAIVARRFGAQVAINLTFLIGWASYSSAQPLRRWQRNVISLAGPTVQILAGGVAMWLLRIAMLPLRDQASLALFLDLHSAIVWSGILLGGLNLLPLWPLDGGHVVESLLNRTFGRAGTRAFLTWTLGASVTMAVVGFTGGDAVADAVARWVNPLRIDAVTEAVPVAVLKLLATVPAIAATSTIFVALFCGIASWGALRGTQSRVDIASDSAATTSAADDLRMRQVRTAERQGWNTGEPGDFPRGWGPSPWLEAHLARSGGAPAEQVTSALSRLAGRERRWVLDDPSRPAVGELLPYLPTDAALTPAAIDVRVYHGPPNDLVASALAVFRGSDEAEAFYRIAEGMAQRRLDDDAMSWLTAAVERRPDPRRVATSRPLGVLHGRSDFQQLLGVAERAVAPQRHGAGDPRGDRR